MHCLKRLKTRLQYNLLIKNRYLINNFFVISLSVILLFLSINHFLLIFLYIGYLFYVFKKSNKVFKIVIIVNLLTLISFIIRMLVIHDLCLNSVRGVVVNINDEKVIIKDKIYKYLIYDDSVKNYDIGDYIKVTGENIPINKSNLEMMFDNQRYLYSKGIVSVITTKETIILDKKINLYYLNRYINDYCNKHFSGNNKAFIKALLFGDNSLITDDISEGIRINGISHLFAISGLHISILVGFLEKILNNNKRVKNIIINSFLLIYLFVLGFLPSVFRTVLMYYFKNTNQKLSLKLSNVDIISISFLIMIIINPFYIYMLGFILSYFVSFIFIISSEYTKKFNNEYQKILILSFFSFVSTIPIVVNINNEINLLSFITNIVFIILMSYILLPATIIFLFVPKLSYIYNIIISIFLKLNIFFKDYFNISITLPNFSIYESLIFYILLYLIIFYKKYNKVIYILKKKIDFYKILIILFIGFSNLYYFKASLNLTNQIEFLDLYEGDCILINSKFNNYTVLIDTGTGKGEVVSKYLIKKGIRKLDYLIITHNHLDHFGEAKVILNKINVNKIIVSAYNNSEFSRYTNSLIVNCNDEIIKKDLKLSFLGPTKKSENENDNSLIIKTKLGNYEYLFLADASNKVLDELEEKADIIKAGHHGSKTSASITFYSKANPKYVIITTGRVKKYNFPDEETISLLNSLNISYYQTNINSTIKIYYFKNKSIITTHW